MEIAWKYHGDIMEISWKYEYMQCFEHTNLFTKRQGPPGIARESSHRAPSVGETSANPGVDGPNPGGHWVNLFFFWLPSDKLT